MIEPPIEILSNPEKLRSGFVASSNEYGYRIFPIFISKFRIDQAGINFGNRSIQWSEIKKVSVRERAVYGDMNQADCRLTLHYDGGRLRFNGSIVQREDSWWRGFWTGFSGITPAYLYLRSEIGRLTSVPYERETYTAFESIGNAVIAGTLFILAILVLMSVSFLWFHFATR